MARQMSTSKPRHCPDESASENPGRPSLTPQCSVPRVRTSSMVPANAYELVASANTASPDSRTAISLHFDNPKQLLNLVFARIWLESQVTAGRMAPVDPVRSSQKSSRSTRMGILGQMTARAVPVASLCRPGGRGTATHVAGSKINACIPLR